MYKIKIRKVITLRLILIFLTIKYNVLYVKYLDISIWPLQFYHFKTKPKLKTLENLKRLNIAPETIPPIHRLDPKDATFENRSGIYGSKVVYR